MTNWRNILVALFAIFLSGCMSPSKNRTPAGDIYQQRVAVDLFTCSGDDWIVRGLPFNIQNKFYENCAPEVLYTWVSQKALSAILTSQKNSVGLVDGNPSKHIYTVRTPLASHAYGDVSLRLKLRSDVKFIFANYEVPFTLIDDGGPLGPLAESKPIRDCNYYRKKYPDEVDRLVIASTLPSYQSFSEYIVCSDKVIDSWSYGTKPHFQEITNEYRLHKSGANVESLMESLTSENKDIRFCPDAKPCREVDLKRRVNHHKSLVESNAGQIFYAPTSRRNELEHFWTNKIFYFSLSNKELEKLRLSPSAQGH